MKTICAGMVIIAAIIAAIADPHAPFHSFLIHDPWPGQLIVGLAVAIPLVVLGRRER